MGEITGPGYWIIFALCTGAGVVFGAFGVMAAVTAGALLLGLRIGGQKQIAIWRAVLLMVAPFLGGAVAVLATGAGL